MFERITNQPNRSAAPAPQAQSLSGALNGASNSAHAAQLDVSRRPSPFDPSDTAGFSIIGTDLTILGEGITIISKNNLRVDGDVRGNVAGKEVVIGPEGSVTGTVSAEKIDVFGGVRGAITSVEVALHDSAQVEGEITHETMTMAQGAYFEGKVRRLTDRTELASKLDPSSYAASAASAS